MDGTQLLVTLLRAHHCRVTHHRFAIDALPLVQTESGRRLVRLILSHHQQYLTGCTDPDTRFRDYQNHVIHVTDGYWGGAPRVAHQWYARLQKYLRTRRYSDAAHAAGVLSHYFTDPLQPMHTQQCSRGRILHRPFEWSVWKAYDQILHYWKSDDMRVVFRLSEGPGWLGEAMLHSARFANRKYHRLVERYDLVHAASHPSAGLGSELRGSLAELFGLAITGWARVLERAAAEAEAQQGKSLPGRSLLVPTTSAIMQIPMRCWFRRLRERGEQGAIGDLIAEFSATGTLAKQLPAEVDIFDRVVKVHHDERRWKQERKRRLASTRTVVEVQPGTDDAPSTIPFVSQQPDSNSADRRAA